MIRNPKYKPNKKNGGTPPPVTNQGTEYIPIPCHNCMECRTQNANNWQVRLIEHHKTRNNGKFLTLTFSDEKYNELADKIHEERIKNHIELSERENTIFNPEDIKPLSGYDLDNEIWKLAVKLMRDRYRKKYGKSLEYWFVSELGQTNTERIHGHGIAYTDISKKEFEDIWGYGFVNKRENTWKDNYCNERTIGYIVKYIYKTDRKHPAYKPRVLASNGIGAGYIKSQTAQINRFKGQETKDYYITRQGYKKGLPKYYREKLYTDQQKEQLWINKIDSKTKWVNGMKIDISKGYEEYNNVIDMTRQLNKRLGYGGILTEEDKKRCSENREIRRLKRYSQIDKDRNKMAS